MDVALDRRLIATDVNEQGLLDLLDGRPARIVVTIIGGQGYLFGRGNQQISPRVIRRVGRDNIQVVATKDKIIPLTGRPLLVDTGDEEVNAWLSGYIRVTTGILRTVRVSRILLDITEPIPRTRAPPVPEGWRKRATMPMRDLLA